MPPKRERNITIFKSDVGRISHVSISGKGGLEAHYYYDSNAALSKIECSSRSDLDPIELLKIINQMFIERIGTIHSIEKMPQATNAELTEGKSWTERWENGFDKNLYYGRTRSYFMTEAGIIDRDLWTAPEIISGGDAIEAGVWRNAVSMKNSLDRLSVPDANSRVNQLYIALPKVFKRARFRLNARLPTLAEIPTNEYVIAFGFETNSQGGTAAIRFQGYWGAYTLGANYLDPVTGAPVNDVLNVTAAMIHLNEWSEYHLELDPFAVRLYEYYGGAWALLGTLPLTAYKRHLWLQPFICNESTQILSNFQIGTIAITAMDDFGTAGLLATDYNVTMVLANTQYSQALPANTKKFLMHTQDESPFRTSFVTGRVAAGSPILTVLSGSRYFEDLVQLDNATVYFASPTAGKIMELRVWTG